MVTGGLDGFNLATDTEEPLLQHGLELCRVLETQSPHSNVSYPKVYNLTPIYYIWFCLVDYSKDSNKISLVALRVIVNSYSHI